MTADEWLDVQVADWPEDERDEVREVLRGTLAHRLHEVGDAVDAVADAYKSHFRALAARLRFDKT